MTMADLPLREEGDLLCKVHKNPRLISIHALREEGDPWSLSCAWRQGLISIHALREEGDVVLDGSGTV